jgi:hypothetical protein
MLVCGIDQKYWVTLILIGRVSLCRVSLWRVSWHHKGAGLWNTVGVQGDQNPSTQLKYEQHWQPHPFSGTQNHLCNMKISQQFGLLSLLQLTICCVHGYGSIHTERANMHCQGIACTRSFDMGLTPTRGQKLECLKWCGNNILIHTMKM